MVLCIVSHFAGPPNVSQNSETKFSQAFNALRLVICRLVYIPNWVLLEYGW